MKKRTSHKEESNVLSKIIKKLHEQFHAEMTRLNNDLKIKSKHLVDYLKCLM